MQGLYKKPVVQQLVQNGTSKSQLENKTQHGAKTQFCLLYKSVWAEYVQICCMTLTSVSDIAQRECCFPTSLASAQVALEGAVQHLLPGSFRLTLAILKDNETHRQPLQHSTATCIRNPTEKLHTNQPFSNTAEREQRHGIS